MNDSLTGIVFMGADRLPDLYESGQCKSRRLYERAVILY